MNFLIDENLPDNFSIWNIASFVHVLKISGINFDSEIWKYALDNSLVIITKDTDFYFRYLTAYKAPKIVWLHISNLRKKEFRLFVENVWPEIQELLKEHNFIIVTKTGLEAFK